MRSAFVLGLGIHLASEEGVSSSSSHLLHAADVVSRSLCMCYSSVWCNYDLRGIFANFQRVSQSHVFDVVIAFNDMSVRRIC